MAFKTNLLESYKGRLAVSESYYAKSHNGEKLSQNKKLVVAKLLENVNNEMVFSKDGEKVWICRNCGHVHVGTNAPTICPVCAHPQAYFEVKSDNYM